MHKRQDFAQELIAECLDLKSVNYAGAFRVLSSHCWILRLQMEYQAMASVKKNNILEFTAWKNVTLPMLPISILK